MAGYPRRMYRIAAASVLAAGLFAAPAAHADVLQCGYPATGYYVRADVAVVIGVLYSCDYPREVNGAHLHQEALTIDAGLNIGGLNPAGAGNGTLGAGLTFGGQAWSSSWRCPDERYLAAQPNPVQAWNKPLKYGKCVALGVAPSAPPDTPWPPDDADAVFVWPPPLAPNSPPPAISPPVDGSGGDVQAVQPPVSSESHGRAMSNGRNRDG